VKAVLEELNTAIHAWACKAERGSFAVPIFGTATYFSSPLIPHACTFDIQFNTLKYRGKLLMEVEYRPRKHSRIKAFPHDEVSTGFSPLPQFSIL
jgi:hypothetical protein